jgi:hypothetical protein
LGFQFSFEVVRDGLFLILGRRQIQGFDHQDGSGIKIELSFQVAPPFSELSRREQVLLPRAIDKGSGLTPQTFNDVFVVDAPPPSLIRVSHSDSG